LPALSGGAIQRTTQLQSLSWYKNRLSRMSAREIGHRIHRVLRTRAEGLGLFSATCPPERLSDADPTPWFKGVAALQAQRYASAADAVLDGRTPIFALQPQPFEGGWRSGREETSCGRDRNRPSFGWNRDPLSGIDAPLSFGKLIDYRDERLVGNIKYLWEPNRHLELVTLGQAYALTDDPRYLKGIAARIDSWLEQCPYPEGVNWASALEAGIRLINWSLTWHLIGQHNSPLFSDEKGAARLQHWLDSIYQHAHFIRHYYSRHSSANNHLIGEAAGVFVAGCTWPYWLELERWADEAMSTLIEAAHIQTHSDGVNREQAVAYQQFVLDFFVLSGLAGRARGKEFPAEYWGNVERMIEFIQAIMDAGGNLAMFGDADDGFVVRLSQESDFCPFRSLLATGAILLNRADFAAKAGSLDDKTRFLLGADEWGAVAEQTADAPAPRRSFPEGGYYILGRDLDTEREIRLIADAGPLGYLSIAAHGHADALSIVLSVAGREILIDPGTYAYHTKPAWRRYFRGTGAHNTVRVDGQDQSVQGGNFMWLRHARAECLEFAHDGPQARFRGRHDGYMRLADPVLHEREILQRGNLVEINDQLDCKARHVVERCWHFSEHCRVHLDGDTVIAEHGPVRVRLRAAEKVDNINRLRGSQDPPGGWVSRRFDVKVPSDSIYFCNNIEGKSNLRTVIEIE
jgi:hypothetical protein